MRKAIHMVLGGTRFLVLIGIGAGILGLAVGGFFFRIQGNDPWLWMLDALRPRRDFAAVGAVLLLGLELAFQFTRPRRNRYRKTLTTKTKEGEVTVGLPALKAEVSRIAEAHHEVVSLEPVILPKKKGMDVELDVRVRGGSQVPELCKALQSEARRAVAENVGVFKVDNVRVNIRELVREPAPKESSPVEETPSEAVDDTSEAPTRAAEDA